ncbi:trypanothione synthetase, putative [Leishmania tarentolae]|uniref:Trypanothione synthetase, putative n=1 Tax=Leishmania tarentolae TaxID=5689 RepID=A0A640KI15_LEITA|nr:trypanothione synthetase, putative [Leishmania tarentolae]
MRRTHPRTCLPPSLIPIWLRRSSAVSLSRSLLPSSRCPLCSGCLPAANSRTATTRTCILSGIVRIPGDSTVRPMGCTSSAEANPNETDSYAGCPSQNSETRNRNRMGTTRHPRPPQGDKIGLATENAASAPHVGPSGLTARSDRRADAVTLHGVCGYTHNGVPAYSNGTSSTWTNKKNFREGIFMGYQWQCVEFARRWLWVAHRLLLPKRSCAYCFASCAYVYRLKEDASPTLRQAREVRHGAAPHSRAGSSSSSKEVGTATEVQRLGPYEKKDAWEKVPAKFVKQGSLVPPAADSLIVYPMSWGSPWGHIGVITAVDLNRSLVYVADQNRYFHDWKGESYSAVFRLDRDKDRFYIRDHESECMGWLTFPTAVEGHDVVGR